MRYRPVQAFRVAVCWILILVSVVSFVHKKSSDVLPTSVALPGGENEYLQFAWDVFLYLNSQAPADSERVIWETYKEAYDVFLPQAMDSLNPPSAWGAPDQPPNCGPLLDKTQAKNPRVIRQISKSSGDVHYSDILDERMQAVGGVLLDQRGKLARYEVRMNETMFEYIVDNKLYNGEVQATFGKPVVWPTGTMELKASWRQLTKEERRDPTFEKKYYVTEALLFNGPDSTYQWLVGTFPDSSHCKVKKMALVGLHIVYKIESNPLFVWMSFEQVDNINPPHGGVASFNDPNCPTNCFAPPTGQEISTTDLCFNCVENCRKSFQYCEGATKTQVVRKIPIPQHVQAFNKKMHAKLGDSRWANYELIGMQFPKSILTFDQKTGERLLANSTMETYNQTYSSCIGCHYFARTTNPLNSSDFSWFLRRAKKPKKFDPSLKELLAHNVKTEPKTRGVMTTTPDSVFKLVKDYTGWGTWPADDWNDFQRALAHPPLDSMKGLAIPGENPHGNFIRIFVNPLGLEGAQTGSFTEGSIILKENLPCQYTKKDEKGLEEQCTKEPGPIYQAPVEWTIMLKMKKGYYTEGGDWYYFKGRLPVPENQSPPFVDVAGKVEACASCHAPNNSGNFMFTYNFGMRPEIRSRCLNPIGPNKIEGCSVN